MDLYQLFITSAEKVGLGIAMSGMMAIMFFYFLKRTLKRHEQDVAIFASLLKDKDSTINNHIAHLTTANIEMKECFVKHDAKMDTQAILLDNVGDKIVLAINNQSELMKEIARFNSNKHESLSKCSRCP